MKRIKVKQINNHIWLLNDNDESTGYLVTGSERGLIIDTMTGYGNVRKVAEEITDFPLTVVNTTVILIISMEMYTLRRYIYILLIFRWPKGFIKILLLWQQSGK